MRYNESNAWLFSHKEIAGKEGTMSVEQRHTVCCMRSQQQTVTVGRRVGQPQKHHQATTSPSPKE